VTSEYGTDRVSITVKVGPALLARIEQARGATSRADFLRQAAIDALDRQQARPGPDYPGRGDVDPDCRAGKHDSCAADPCACPRHADPAALCWGDLRNIEAR
jgi:hypothetical protein